MLKKTLSVLALMAAGTGMALGQDATTAVYPAASLQAPVASGSVPPVTPPGRPSPYSNYQATTMAVDGTPGSAVATAPVAGPVGGCANGGCYGGCGNGAAGCVLHGWFIGEYLMLFPSRMSVPTVLTDTTTGAPLAGNSPDLGITHGFRINMGMWLCDGDLGMQSTILGTFRSYVTVNQPAGIIAGFNVPVTNFSYQSWFQMDGGEGNTLLHIAGDENTKLYAVGGGRYLNVSEDVTMKYTFAGANFFDDFHTRDQFFGFQVGAMAIHQTGQLEVVATAKIALGVNYAQLWVLGSNTSLNVINTQAFTQASNIGYYESNYFGVLPEATINVGYKITERLGVRVGYTFLMDINMWRAGEQITTTIPPVIAPPTRSTLFVHGFNAGVTFNY